MRRNKLLFYIFSLAVVGILSGCSKELDLEPENGSLTKKQINEAKDALKRKENDPRSGSAIAGMYGALKDVHNHHQNGFPGVMLMLEARTDAMLGTGVSYDQYRYYSSYRMFEENRPGASYVYSRFYAFIREANEILADPSINDKEKKIDKAQALAFRAYMYFNLVQCYQFTYVGNKEKLGVPIVTELTTPHEVQNNPRQTVEAVYEFILKDLTEALELLGGQKAGSRTKIGADVVHGILARVYLVMQDYAKAHDHAKAAIKISQATPYSLKEASHSNFQDGTDHNVLWSAIYTSEDEGSRTIITFSSQMCPYPGFVRYADVAPHRLNPVLYNSMNETDVRKNWWFSVKKDGNEKLLPEKSNLKGLISYYVNVKGYTPAEAYDKVKELVKDFLPVSNQCCKYAPPENSFTLAENSGDFPLMRVEEMYLIKAEAMYKSGDQAGGVSELEKFIVGYRDPAYNYATVGGTFDDEIYRQRQIEFFGEGLSFFDMLRLKRDLVRSKSLDVETEAFFPGSRFDLKADDPRMILQFPQRERLRNSKLEQNPFIPFFTVDQF